jgi:hypothetical protein
MKSRRMRWAEHVTPMGALINLYKIFVGNSEEKVHSEDLCGVDGRIILERILGR